MLCPDLWNKMFQSNLNGRRNRIRLAKQEIIESTLALLRICPIYFGLAIVSTLSPCAALLCAQNAYLFSINSI